MPTGRTMQAFKRWSIFALPAFLSFSALGADRPQGDQSGGPVGGEYVFQQVAHLTAEERQAIKDRLARNTAQLKAEGKLGPPQELIVLLDWPLIAHNGLTDFGYHGVSNFVDQNPLFPGLIEDYNCGTRTYDLADGYNHQGIDYFTWPFGWYNLANDHVAIVAAAAGTIIGKDDGNQDQSCSLNSSPWNAVYVQHADGSVAWYGHMKTGSTTPKNIGETVAVGEYLGIVGSSGSSSTPHLHLEIYDSLDNLIEPYSGPCNVLNATSWWNAQRPYYDSAINRLQSGKSPPFSPVCPLIESRNDTINFSLGETVYLTAFYRDQLLGQVGTYTIYKPDGTVFDSWTHSSGATHFSASWWFWSRNLSSDAGVWKWQVVYEGQTYEHFFNYGLPFCGDGAIDGLGETCDDAGESITCDSDCTAVECGDSTLNVTAGEQCDDGNTTPGDGCSDTCMTEECGDGDLDPGEECDDGNTTSGDGCSDVCLNEVCGNGIIDLGPTVVVVDPVALPIPDGGPGVAPGPVASDTIEIATSTPIFDLNVDVGITHTWIGHLTFSVESPGGTVITLWDQVCYGIDFQDILAEFDDEGTAAFCNPSGPTPDPLDGNGNIPPLGGTPLSVLDGTDAQGTWTFRIYDNEGFETGTLDQWSLHIVPREACDDGNVIPGDGCSDLCALEDNDGDGVNDNMDNCPLTPNPGQGTAYFDGVVTAVDTSLEGWVRAQDVEWVRGDLSGLSSYTTLASGTTAATTSHATPQIPALGAGYFWLFKPDCPDSSWSSEGSGECAAGCPVGERDGNLP